MCMLVPGTSTVGCMNIIADTTTEEDLLRIVRSTGHRNALMDEH